MADMSKRKTMFGFSMQALFAFVISIIICAFMISAVIIARENAVAMQTEQFLMEKGMRIEDTLSRLFFKTEVLSALVYYGSGDIVGFDTVAPLIVDDPVIMNVMIAPEGIVSKAYSAYEDVNYLIGLNLFDEEHHQGFYKARLAYETGELVMKGPFMSALGYYILMGGLPVYMDLERTQFWGIVVVTLRFPEALDNAELGRLRLQGYEYILWRTDEYTNQRQTLSTNVNYADYYARYVEKSLHFLHSVWYLRLKAIYNWYADVEVIALMFSGLFISLLVLGITQNNFRLKQTKAELDKLAKTDALTGIYNRRHFVELAKADNNRAQRSGETAFVVLVDADHFKKVNDTYGHLVGDKVLIELAERMHKALRPYDILARYGGEEFIIYLCNLTEETAVMVTERLRLGIQESEFEIAGFTFPVTASFGVAPYTQNSIEAAIKNADDALYKAKNEGRNRVVFHDNFN